MLPAMDKPAPVAAEDGSTQLPAGWRAVAMLKAAGVLHPTERQLTDLTARLCAEDPNTPLALAMTEGLLNANALVLDELGRLGMDHALCAAENNARLFLDYLERLHRAGGDVGEFARTRLLRFAAAAVVRLNALTDDAPAAFRPIAETEESWPVLLNQTGESVKLAEARCRGLNVGAACGLNVVPKPGCGKKPSPLSTPTNREVRRLNTVIESARMAAAFGEVNPVACPWLDAARDLPAIFDGTSWPAWFKVGWEVLCHETGGRPETREDLQKLGETRVSGAALRKLQDPGSGEDQRRAQRGIPPAGRRAAGGINEFSRQFQPGGHGENVPA